MENNVKPSTDPCRTIYFIIQDSDRMFPNWPMD